MPYRKRGKPPTKAELRQKEIYKRNRKRDQRNDSRMRKYYERRGRGGCITLILFGLAGTCLAAFWLAYQVGIIVIR
jgi:hypothetical protein